MLHGLYDVDWCHCGQACIHRVHQLSVAAHVQTDVETELSACQAYCGVLLLNVVVIAEVVKGWRWHSR